jgi:plasmid stability protein
MAALLIKDLPAELHRRLKRCASRHRRSLTQEILVLLEEALAREDVPRELPPAFRGPKPLTDAWLKKAKQAGRA